MFLSLLVVALMSVHPLYARGKKEIPEDVRAQIIQAMKEVSFSDGGSVSIYLNIDDSKKVSVYRVEGSDLDLVSSVKSELSTYKFDPVIDVAGKYEIKIKFVDVLSASTSDLVANK